MVSGSGIGVMEEVQPLRNQWSEEEYNKVQVRLELQADYLSGVWAHHAQGMSYLAEGDLKEALTRSNSVRAAMRCREALPMAVGSSANASSIKASKPAT